MKRPKPKRPKPIRYRTHAVAEVRQSWAWFVGVPAALAAVLVALILAGTARADYSWYCGHGYVSNGGVKDVFWKQYDDGLKHHHVYRTFVKLNGLWYYAHQHDRVC